MDYDKTRIADTYDAARAIQPEAMRQWLGLVARHAPVEPQIIVDVGCGTGRFTHPLAECFPGRVIGIDPSAKMLEGARSKPTNSRVEFRQAPAEQLPLEDGSADVVFMSMMLHHLDDRARAAGECRRVLRQGGCLCVRNSTRDSTYPQQRFFPGLQAIIDSQLPSRDEVIALFEGTGLRLEGYERVSYRLAASWQEVADKLALRADSFIVRLSESEFAAGLDAMRTYAAPKGAPEELTDHLHFFAFGV
jgi:ubiquinone/menaquinone biosynthesis C-methylase UbiE